MSKDLVKMIAYSLSQKNSNRLRRFQWVQYGGLEFLLKRNSNNSLCLNSWGSCLPDMRITMQITDRLEAVQKSIGLLRFSMGKWSPNYLYINDSTSGVFPSGRVISQKPSTHFKRSKALRILIDFQDWIWLNCSVNQWGHCLQNKE